MDRELRAQGMTGGSQALRHKVRLWVSLDGAYGAEAREVLALGSSMGEYMEPFSMVYMSRNPLLS